MISKYLPSKKFTIIVGTAALVLLVGWGAYAYFSGGKAFFTKKDSQQGMLVSDVINRDTDGDGIPDWEETLWGTDPTKKDTNGDGIPDNVEIEKRRLALDANNPSTSNDAQINETERFAREFFTTVSSLKASGDLNQNSISNLALGFGKNINDFQKLPDVYTGADVKSVPASDSATRAYYTAFKKIANNHAEDIGGELDALAKGIDTEDPAQMTTVAGFGDMYSGIAAELKALSVPQDAVTMHLSLMNSYAKIGTALKNMSTLLDNPLLGLVGLSQYQDEDAKAADTIKSLGEYFKTHGII